jgi:ribulose-5-phosphate 4-epimerase/fuculose-1-phosphate aldolase
MLEHAEYMNHSGHCSVRRDETSFFVNSGASVRATLGVDDVVAVDLDGNPVDDGTAWPPLEFPIHAEIYRARPEVNAVIHTHPQWSTYLTSAGLAPEVVYAQAAVLGDLPVLDTPESINTAVMGQRMVKELGDNPVILLKAHGGVSAGTDLLECFAFAAYVEENARRQYMTLQIGRPYVLSDDERAAYRERLHKPALFQKAWDFYHSKVS